MKKGILSGKHYNKLQKLKGGSTMKTYKRTYKRIVFIVGLIMVFSLTGMQKK